MKEQVAEFPICQFVAKLAPDPANPPKLRKLRGYPGAAAASDCVRLYLDPELSEYVDLPSAAVRHVQDAPRLNEPEGLVDVWIDRDTALRRSPERAAGLDLLTGAIRLERSGLPRRGPRHADTAVRGPVGTEKPAADTCGECPPAE